jgi:acyl-homoserine-lactone acylase
MKTTTLTACALFILAAAPSASAEGRYEARIRRTTYGVAHIEAKDLASLGFGDGYAQAEDHLCSIADQVIKVRGERARYFGEGRNREHLASDAVMKGLDLLADAARDLERQPKDVRDWYAGFVAGYNEYLKRQGKEKVGGWCRGAEWVGPITVADIAAYHRLITLTVPNFTPLIATATPPAAGRPTTSNVEPAEFEAGASNGWALGRDKTESGRGMLIANPHYPWVGSNRFWEKHLTIPGQVDVYGVSLIGIPGVGIGFTRAFAWTHTVSAGKRWTLYTLELVPGQPTVYRYGSGQRAMTPKRISVSVRQADGSQKTVEHTVWFSHYGPILNFPGVGWTAQRALAVRDANWDNSKLVAEHLAINRARSFKEFEAVHAKYQALPWINTIAASADGTAWYTDSATTPKLSAEAIELWQKRRTDDDLTRRLWQQGGHVLLDGSDPRFEWQADAAARTAGVVAYRDMPKLTRSDYVFNANDSFWLANSTAPIEGAFSPLHGDQRTARSLRTRNNDLTLSGRSPDAPAGTDGKFSLEELGKAILSNRALAAELLRDDLVARCRQQASVSIEGAKVDLTAACETLARWDLRNDLTSRGAVLFKEFMGRYEPQDLGAKGKLWAVDFDTSDPVRTPRALAPGTLACENLARAAQLLAARGFAPDVPLGEVQYADKAGRRIPIHGGDGAYDGLMNMQRNARNTTTLEPMDNPAQVPGSRFLTEKGYPIGHGSSFLMAMEFTDRGPRAMAFLTYSQSGDPASPHFSDQTDLFSKKQWRPILFREADIAGAVEREYRVSGAR